MRLNTHLFPALTQHISPDLFKHAPHHKAPAVRGGYVWVCGRLDGGGEAPLKDVSSATMAPPVKM